VVVVVVVVVAVVVVVPGMMRKLSRDQQGRIHFQQEHQAAVAGVGAEGPEEGEQDGIELLEAGVLELRGDNMLDSGTWYQLQSGPLPPASSSSCGDT
jgi:hypothetical protein